MIKGCIVAEPGYKIITQDLATAEVYGAAVLSQDKNLMAAFVAGEDFHSYVAHTMFNLKAKISEVKQLFPIYRQAAKAITFGILFGSGAAKVAETVNKEGGNLSKEEAQEFIDLYFGKFPQLKRYLDTTNELIKKNGFLYSFFGRKRRLINVHSPDKSIASHEVRSGINFLIQSVASDVNLLAAVEARKEYIRLGLRATIFALIHDAILVHVHEDDAEQAAQILKVCTKKDRGCSIPTFPIGTDTSIVNDYSEGKFEKTYGEKFKEFNLSRISSGVS